jgi:hypothetical protein
MMDEDTDAGMGQPQGLYRRNISRVYILRGGNFSLLASLSCPGAASF